MTHSIVEFRGAHAIFDDATLVLALLLAADHMNGSSDLPQPLQQGLGDWAKALPGMAPGAIQFVADFVPDDSFHDATIWRRFSRDASRLAILMTGPAPGARHIQARAEELIGHEVTLGQFGEVTRALLTLSALTSTSEGPDAGEPPRSGAPPSPADPG